MGALLKVGRVGLDVELNSPQDVGYRGRDDGRRVTISGYLRADSLLETKVLRSELLAQVGQLVPVTYTTDDGLDGIVTLDQASVDLSWRDGALQDPGYFRFELQVTFIGSYAETEFQSLLTMVDAAEDHSTTASYWHSPPVGAKAYSAGATSPTLIERPTEDGDIWVAYDMTNPTHPTWSVDPAAYYGGAVEVWAGDRLRAGRVMPMDVTDWLVGNGLMEIRPSAFQGTTDGKIEVRFYDGTAWGSWTDFRIIWADTNEVPGWDYVTILQNTPAVATVRLIRDALESPFATTAKHELDITLRRGGVFASCVYKFDGSAQTHGVYRASNSAATRPGGDASYITYDTAISGDTLLLGCPKAFTEKPVAGGLALSSASQTLPFFLGAAIDGAANATGNGPADIAEQYVGQVAESVRAVRR